MRTLALSFSLKMNRFALKESYLFLLFTISPKLLKKVKGCTIWSTFNKSMINSNSNKY